ncbi:hypothetical protein ACVIGB_009000 [Bradyrhizobium sp. USDA 4341]
MEVPKNEILVAISRVSLLIQLMRLLLRERALECDQTPEDILAWSEDIKRFYEQHAPPGPAESYLTAAADEFFNQLALEVKQDREDR